MCVGGWRRRTEEEEDGGGGGVDVVFGEGGLGLCCVMMIMFEVSLETGV